MNSKFRRIIEEIEFRGGRFPIDEALPHAIRELVPPARTAMVETEITTEPLFKAVFPTVRRKRRRKSGN